jgi:hypothetical protein
MNPFHHFHVYYGQHSSRQKPSHGMAAAKWRIGDGPESRMNKFSQGL